MIINKILFHQIVRFKSGNIYRRVFIRRDNTENTLALYAYMPAGTIKLIEMTSL